MGKDTQTALITGGTSGIGRATANLFAANGIHVIITGRDAERSKQTVNEIQKKGGKVDFINAHLVDAQSAKDVAKKALKLADNGKIDILINNVGMAPFGATADMDEATFDTAFGTNVKVPFFLVAELAPKMAEHGKGAVVSVSSMAGSFGMMGMSLYGSTKSALNQLAKAWSVEFGGQGVRFNTVSPGPVRTLGTEAMGDSLDQLAAMAPAIKVATPEQIADAIYFLASDASSHIYGVNLAVDGGRAALSA